ncbi:auxin efflux carrier component 6-like [Zingiber officinale]|uniref:auxin efflux carrier component 6-like n=1 Tax=Zingiber officinale TaxID=94328 RepID=UPI001C4D1837|nr:auxin efflux carrier component 6-like [Zingiber officinale]
MIAWKDFYAVMCAMIPLYFAMFLAYGSVKWWKIFTPEQCSGVNRFVATFAVPVLSFHFIAQNNPFQMDFRFLLADTLSKLFVLFLLFLWASFSAAACSSSRRRLDWVITLFSVGTLPNTLVMGIPLLRAMYGDFTQSLMVQLVVLQCIIWYTLLLFLFEYRAATLMIQDQFPGAGAAAITKFEIDGDIISLDGRDPLQAESEIDAEGRIRVRIRRSTSSAPGSAISSSLGITPRRLSNISGAEIYSVNTPVRPAPPAEQQLTVRDITFGYRSASPYPSGYASSDAYSLQPTPRASNFNETEVVGTPAWARSPACRPTWNQSPAPSLVWPDGGQGDKDVGEEKDLSFRSTAKFVERKEDEQMAIEYDQDQEMPATRVMVRLILTMVGRKLSRNPNTYSSVLGLLWSLISFKWNLDMPILVKESIKIISDAGLGMAMFSLGLFMALQPRIIACGPKMAAISMSIRFLSGPMVMSAASMAVKLRGVKLHTAIVQAALPQGIVPFVFAREYGLHPDILSTGVIFGMLVSLPVTLLYYVLLGL